MKTHHPKLADLRTQREWYILDAENLVLGKLAVRVADMLRGKHKPNWHPSVDCGDNIVVINADKVVLTGKKNERKQYIRHTGFPGALRFTPAHKMRADHPERIIQDAVFGMISKTRLKRLFLAKLHVYAGTKHPHTGQNPKPLTLV